LQSSHANLHAPNASLLRCHADHHGADTALRHCHADHRGADVTLQSCHADLDAANAALRYCHADLHAADVTFQRCPGIFHRIGEGLRAADGRFRSNGEDPLLRAWRICFGPAPSASAATQPRAMSRSARGSRRVPVLRRVTYHAGCCRRLGTTEQAAIPAMFNSRMAGQAGTHFDLKALNQNGLTRFAAEKRHGLTSHSAVESRRNDDQRLGGVEDWRGRCPPPFPVPAHRTDMRISRIRRSDEAIVLSPTGRDPGQGWRVKRVSGRHGALCGAG
jgi:hypothetical protein